MAQPSITEELLCTQCHKNHVHPKHPWHRDVMCLWVNGQNLNPSPPSARPPVQRSFLRPILLPWPVWDGSVGCRSPCGASPSPCRPPAAHCWAAGGRAKAGGWGTAPSHWNVSASQGRSKRLGGCDPNGQTVGGSLQRQLLQLDLVESGGTW